ncbi:MEI5 protein [Metarhizium guizhouense ARSEF 977]|uniref:MEI5 protein n=1 Tax=Metarhizium guizhouense (strain ARSEF 977) TaxID=1276136 RepID=A0A0B4HVT8_METGA|nr:MEI5 protein [Metarhizium guizhouense ARSEF 977]
MDDKNPQKPAESTSSPNGSNGDGIQELFAFMGKYSSSEKFKKLQRLDQDNEELRQEVIDLRTTNDKNLDDFIRRRDIWKTEREGLTSQLKEKEDQRNQELLSRKAAEKSLDAERTAKKTLCEQMKEQEATILRLVEKTKTNETEITRLGTISKEQNDALDRAGKAKIKLQGEVQKMHKELVVRTKELSNAGESLAIFRTFLVQLSPLGEKKAQIREALADTFNSAWDFFQKTLGQDIEPSVLVRSNSQAFALNPPSLPLPASNTNNAKGMRVAAGLIAYAKALTTHVFRQTHITQSRELDGVLHLTAAQNPEQAACIRAVLLKALPERQKQNQDESINKAVKEVSDAVCHWLQNKQPFESGLKHVCERASATWALMQLVEERIQPDFHFEVPDEWQVLPLPTSKSTSTSPPKPGPARQTPQHQKNMENRQANTLRDSPKLSVLSNNDVARVVWPTFLAAYPQGQDETGSAPLELVYHGYVLTQAQIKSAEDESSEASQRAPPSTSVRKRRNSAVYVSNGSVSGSLTGK